jgi:hypothetical protein
MNRRSFTRTLLSGAAFPLLRREETEDTAGPPDEPLVIAGRTLTPEERAAAGQFLARHEAVMGGLRGRPLSSSVPPALPPRPSPPSDRGAAPR